MNAVVAILVAAAWWIATSPPTSTRRLAATPGGVPGVVGARPRWTPVGVGALCAGLLCPPLVGGVAGWLLGCAAVAGAVVLRQRPPQPGHRRTAARADRDLPLVADLLASTVRGGVSLERAAHAVASAVGGPLGAALDEVAVATVRLGADPVRAWALLDVGRAIPDASRRGGAAPGPDMDGGQRGPRAAAGRRVSSSSGRATGTSAGKRGSASPAVPAFGRAVARAVDGGAPLAEALERIAQDQRARHRADAMAAAARVGVHAVGPLALCFLPAFVLIGVLPLVLAVTGDILTGLS